MQRFHLLATTSAAALALAAPASAATPTYGASASAEGISLSILGQDVLTLADVEADVDDNRSLAEARAATVLGEDLPGSRAAVEVTSGSDADGENCVVPDPGTPLVSFAALCANAAGSAAGLGSASADSGIASLGLRPEALVTSLTALVLTPIEEQLTPVFEEVENVVDNRVQAELEAACATDAVPLAEVQQAIEEAPVIGGVVTPITGALPDNNACTVLLQFVSNAPQLDDVQQAIDDLTAALADELLQLATVEISLGAEASVRDEGQLLGAEADMADVTLTLPSLDVVDLVLTTALEGPAAQFVDELDAIVGGLGDQAPDLPAVGDVVADVREQLQLPILTDADPILVLTVAGPAARVDVDTANGTITPSATGGGIQATLSESLADLLDQPRTVSVGPGEEQLLFEGTPIETRLAVGAASTDATSARAELVALELFRATEGGIVLNIGAVEATGLVTPGSVPAPSPEPLPVTGGGMVLGGLATMAATLLRRRS